MTGHTKEPWRTDPDYPADIQSADGKTEIATTNEIGIPSGVRAPKQRKQEANARRIVDCVNALAGIPDPLAFVQAARGMAEKAAGLASDVQDILDQRSDCGDWGSECPLQDAHKPDSTIDRLQQLLDALEAFRAATGEQS